MDVATYVLCYVISILQFHIICHTAQRFDMLTEDLVGLQVDEWVGLL